MIVVYWGDEQSKCGVRCTDDFRTRLQGCVELCRLEVGQELAAFTLEYDLILRIDNVDFDADLRAIACWVDKAIYRYWASRAYAYHLTALD